MNSNTIIRRPDGSIDIEFYLKRGRLIRSRKAGTLVHRLRQCLASLASPAVRPYGARLWSSGPHHPRD
jgi:hypothetical protein